MRAQHLEFLKVLYAFGKYTKLMVIGSFANRRPETG
jgi:uncharacterized protein YciI